MPEEIRTSADEAAPLLSSLPRQQRPGHKRFASLASITSIHIPKAHNKRTIVNLLALVIFLAGCGGGLTGLPQARLIEDVICHEHYHQLQSLDTPIDEKLCKVEAISAELAFILAITSALSAGLGLLVTFPWSAAADRYGRKPVLSLCLAGITLGSVWTTLVLWFRFIFPVRMVWLESVGQLIGGGNPIALGLLMAMITDSTNEEERAIMFMRIHVASLAGNLLAPTLASLLMDHYDPWLPLMIGNVCFACTPVIVLFIPETLQTKTPAQVPEDGSNSQSQPTSRLFQMLAKFKEAVPFARSPSLICLLVACLASMPVTFSTSLFMPVFISKRYDTKLLQGGYVQSAFGIAQMAALFVVIPWVSRSLMRTTNSKLRPADEHHRDIIIARWSAGITLLAAVVLGLAPTLPLFLVGLAILSLGSATFSFNRSLMSLYVDPKHRSRLYGLVGMVEILGQIYAQPMLAELFALGMRLGRGWIGLPYFGLAGLMAGVTGLLLFVRVSHKAKEPEDGENGEF